jgi:hypothetical protein
MSYRLQRRVSVSDGGAFIQMHAPRVVGGVPVGDNGVSAVISGAVGYQLVYLLAEAVGLPTGTCSSWPPTTTTAPSPTVRRT